MIKKCLGCGSVLQYIDPEGDGYIEKKNYSKSDICERCFRIKNYGEYKQIVKTNQDFIKILKDIDKTNDLVILVLDVLNLPKDLSMIKEYLDNNIIAVLTKRDLLPRSIKDEKLLKYLENYEIRFIDKMVVSSNKNYGFDELMKKINKYKISNNVYVVGYTNAGKSTMINKIIHNYTNQDSLITTSILPSTTLNTLDIKISDELTIIDTPGLLDKGNIMNDVSVDVLKKIIPKKFIKPLTFQIRKPQSIKIEDYIQIVCNNSNDITFYMSNTLVVDRSFKEFIPNEKYKKYVIDVHKACDIVINGLGFISVKKADQIIIYSKFDIDIYTRKPLI